MKSKNTLCIHAGNEVNTNNPGVNNPIHVSSSFKYREMEDTVYPRYFNTNNQKTLIDRLCALEQAEAGLVFSSGMAAISTALLALLNKGDHLVLSPVIYGGTYHLILKEFEKRGIEYSFAEDNSVAGFEAVLRDNTKMIYFETPSNPLCSVVSIQAVAKLAKEHNLMTAIDNTFASPINQNPIPMGIDLVLHSGTKYLGGHSDLCFGATLGSQKHIDKIMVSARNFGASLNPLDCYLIDRSLKTLAVRVERHNANALALAEYLEGHSAIGKIHYPGLRSHPDHNIARAQMRGFGGMMGMELKTDDLNQVDKFLDHLKIITPALSLGGVESLICSPAVTSHLKMPKAEREKIGVTDGLLRFSVGIEHQKDLIHDIEQALAAIGNTTVAV